jgi:hypothetical protein
LSSPFLKFPESFRIQKTKYGMSDLIQVLSDLKMTPPILERLENDSLKADLIQSLRDLKMTYPNLRDLNMTIQVLRDLKMTH